MEVEETPSSTNPNTSTYGELIFNLLIESTLLKIVFYFLSSNAPKLIQSIKYLNNQTISSYKSNIIKNTNNSMNKILILRKENVIEQEEDDPEVKKLVVIENEEMELITSNLQQFKIISNDVHRRVTRTSSQLLGTQEKITQQESAFYPSNMNINKSGNYVMTRSKSSKVRQPILRPLDVGNEMRSILLFMVQVFNFYLSQRRWFNLLSFTSHKVDGSIYYFKLQKLNLRIINYY
jgi:hypothetical protein